jgi:sn-glycerol 3-phosphate transport system substrate-binding protein
MHRLAPLALASAGFAAAAPAAAQTQISMWFGLGGRLMEEVLAQCDRFNAAQDEVFINCSREGTYDEIFQKAIAAYRTGNQPHILQVVDRGTGSMMLSGAVYPAYRLVSEFGLDIDWSDYFPQIGNYYADTQGNYWAFPFNSSTAMVYYNVDAIRAAGFEEFPRTWEDVDALMRALREKAGFDCTMAWRWDLWVDLEQFSAIHDIPVSTRANGYEGLDAELRFNQTRFVQHMERQLGWYKDGLVRYDMEFSALRDLFVRGECPIFFDSIAGLAAMKAMTADTALNWSAAELPHYAEVEPRNNLIGGAALWVFDGFTREEYEAVGKFFSFIARPDQQILWSDATGYVPVTVSAYEQLLAEGYYDRPENLPRKLAIQSLLRAEPTENSKGIRLGNWIEIRNIVVEELQRTLTGDQTVQVALDNAAARGNTLLRRFADTFPGQTMP